MKLDNTWLSLRGRAALSSRAMRLRYRWKPLLTVVASVIVFAILVMLSAFIEVHQRSTQASGAGPTQLPAPSTSPHDVVPSPSPSPPDATPTTMASSDPYSFLAPDESGGSAIRLDPCGGPLVLNYNPSDEGYPAIFDVVRVGQELGTALDHIVVWHVVGQGDVPDGVVVDVGWVHNPADIAPDDPDVLGIGGPKYVGDTIVRGQVQLVAVPTNGLPAPGMGPGEFGTVLAHELGHVVGLEHVNDAVEIMNPSLQPDKDAQYAPGDLAGLHLLGGACD